MNELKAHTLISQYIAGWKENNIEKILSCFDKNCIVIESHGPIYNGVDAIEKWFTLWLETKSKVLKWEIKTFSFCEKTETEFCEWEFSCVSDGRQYDDLFGISVVRFVGDRIGVMREYRMTREGFMWMGDILVLE